MTVEHWFKDLTHARAVVLACDEMGRMVEDATHCGGFDSKLAPRAEIHLEATRAFIRLPRWHRTEAHRWVRGELDAIS